MGGGRRRKEDTGGNTERMKMVDVGKLRAALGRGKGREAKATKNCKQKVGRDKGIDIGGQQGGRKGPKINGKNVDMINSIEV